MTLDVAIRDALDLGCGFQGTWPRSRPFRWLSGQKGTSTRMVLVPGVDTFSGSHSPLDAENLASPQPTTT